MYRLHEYSNYLAYDIIDFLGEGLCQSNNCGQANGQCCYNDGPASVMHGQYLNII